MTNELLNTSASSYLNDIANGNRQSPTKDMVYFSRLIEAAQNVSENSRYEAIYQIAREVSDQSPFQKDKVAEMVKKANLCSKCTFNATVREIKQKDTIWDNSKDSSTTQKVKLPTDDEIYNRWLNTHPNTVYGLGSFRRFENNKWTSFSEKEIMKEIYDQLEAAKEEENLKPNYPLLKNITELAKVLADVPAKEWDTDFNLLPCKNGILRLDTRELLPYDPSYHFTNGVEIEYDPKAKCPNFLKALESTIPNEMELVQRFFGDCLSTDNKHEIALMFVGPPGCGKSTILSGVSNVLGPRAGELGIRDIEENQFSLPLIIGKTCLISTEQPTGFLTKGDVINKIISGETLPINQKNDPIFFYRPIAKIIWAMNEIPKIRNLEQNGLSRRFIVIKFPELAEGLRNIDLKMEIKNETPGILNYFLDGYSKLQSDGKYIIPPSMLLANYQKKETDDNMANFIAEKCKKGATLQIQSCRFNEAYSIWCNEKGFNQKSSVAVSDDLKRLNFSKHTSCERVFWIGLDLK